MTAVAELIRVGDPKRAAAELSRPALFLAGSVARAGRAEHPAQAAAIERIVLAECARGARGTDERPRRARRAREISAAPPCCPGCARRSPPATRGCAPPPRERCGWSPTPRPIGCWPRRCAAIATRPCAPRRYSPRDSGSSTRWSTRSPKRAQRDPVDYVRAGAVTLLARNRQLSPRIERALADVASNDPKPDLRRLAPATRAEPRARRKPNRAYRESARRRISKFLCLLFGGRSTTNSSIRTRG